MGQPRRFTPQDWFGARHHSVTRSASFLVISQISRLSSTNDFASRWYIFCESYEKTGLHHYAGSATGLVRGEDGGAFVSTGPVRGGVLGGGNISSSRSVLPFRMSF